MQVTFGVNMVAIADGKPRLMGLREMLSHYIRHQKDVVTQRTRHELEQAEARAHILEGLIVAVDNLDEVIRLIRGSKNPKEAREKLVARFALSEIQAQAILDSEADQAAQGNPRERKKADRGHRAGIARNPGEVC